MYSRNYYGKDSESFSLPRNYDGTAFAENNEKGENATRPPANEETMCSNQALDNAADAECGGHIDAPEGGLVSGILNSIFGFRGRRLLPNKIGTEEILILATAAFLFFSRDGDRECALLLLLLLLIN